MKGDNCSWNHCDRVAIGYESSPVCGINVCEEHSSKKMKELKPGEEFYDDCFRVERYTTDQ